MYSNNKIALRFITNIAEKLYNKLTFSSENSPF